MTHDDHASIETLGAFVEQPQSGEFARLRAHLLVCPDCRRQAAGLAAARAALLRGHPHLGAQEVPDEAEALRVADYLEGRLEAREAREIARRLSSDQGALKAALHYAAHSEGMRRHAPPQSRPLAGNAPTRSAGLLRTLAGWFAWRPPVWIGVPVTAALALAVLALLRPWGPADERQGMMVAAYQDEAAMTFSAAAPGIGFFDSARQTRREYAPVEVTLGKDGVLAMRWPPVERAQGYVLDLYRIEGATRTAIGQIATQQTTAEFTALELQAGRRYEWVLSGTAGDGRAFRASGGFVTGERN